MHLFDAARRNVWGLLALTLLIGAVIALIWSGQAHSGLDMTGYPYADAVPAGDALKRRLLAFLLGILAVGGLFGVVAWLADLHSARMSRRRRAKAPSGPRPKIERDQGATAPRP